MKITFIQPPIKDFYATKIRMTPLGLLYLAAALKEKGHEVSLIDAMASDTKKTIPLPKEFGYLKNFYISGDKSPFKLFGSYYHFGMSEKELRNCIINENADIYCISASMTPYYIESLHIAEIIKKELPQSTTIMGGAHASLVPESLLINPGVDYVIRGEAELILPKVLDLLSTKSFDKLKDIKGLCFKKNNETIINEATEPMEIDSIPYPKRDLMKNNFYFLENKKISPIILSRGCPHRCVYCSVPKLFSYHYRVRNPQSVVDEMLYCYKNFGIQIFDFEDDNLTYNEETALTLFELIAKNFNEKTGIECCAMNGLTTSSLNHTILKTMKNAHFKTLNLALITADSSLKQNLNRPFTASHFKDIVLMANDIGFKITGYQIIGMPNQTIEEMTETFLFLKSLPLKTAMSVYYPIPKTPMFETCFKNNFISEKNFISFRSSAMPIQTNNFHRKDIFTFLIASRIHNYCRDNSLSLSEIINFDYTIIEDSKSLKIGSNKKLMQNEAAFLILKLWKERRKIYAICTSSKNLTTKNSNYYYDLIELPISSELLILLGI